MRAMAGAALPFRARERHRRDAVFGHEEIGREILRQVDVLMVEFGNAAFGEERVVDQEPAGGQPNTAANRATVGLRRSRSRRQMDHTPGCWRQFYPDSLSSDGHAAQLRRLHAIGSRLAVDGLEIAIR